MSEQKRVITVTDGNGKELYRGPDKRLYSQDYPVCALGIPIMDWIKVGSIIVGVTVFLITDNLRIRAMEDWQKKATETFDGISQYMKESDTFHTVSTGIEFQGGRPADYAAFITRTKKLNKLIDGR